MDCLLARVIDADGDWAEVNAVAWNEQKDFIGRVGFGELLKPKDRP
jgi:hypothetical protein